MELLINKFGSQSLCMSQCLNIITFVFWRSMARQHTVAYNFFQKFNVTAETVSANRLTNLSPLPVSALQNAAFQNLFSFTHFNPLQTQAFHALYHMTSENVLLCSPTGSGKTVACELALLALRRDHPKENCVPCSYESASARAVK